jgi:signal transduction histidine kinase/ActR/RegA family two-component response regulator
MKINFIKSKYGFLPFVGVLLFLFIIVFFIVENEKREIYYNKNMQDTEREAEMLSLMIKDALTKGDYVAVENFISSWGLKRSDINKVKIVSKNNFIIGDYSKPYKAVEPHNIKININYGGGKQVALELVVDFAHIDELFYHSTIKLFVSVLIIFLVIGGLLWRVLAITAFRPLENEIALRNQFEEELIEAKDMAETANNAKSEFLSRMSHELRTPLNAIIGFSQLLEHDCKDKQSKENVREIYIAGKHLLGLINDVLELSKIEAGYVEMDLGSVDINYLFHSVFGMLSAIAIKNNIRLVNCIEENNNIYVVADQYKLNQVFINLISNAIKYNSESGEVKVDVDFLKDERVRINFTDTGKGLSEKEQLHLFQPFERLGAENTSVEGSGMGLVITRKLIELMGGEVGVDSKIGCGSTFWVILPLAKKEILVDISKSDSELLSNNSKNSKHNLSNKILYIEDNPANFRLVENIIKKHTSFELLSSVSGNDGIKVAIEQKPYLILLDLNLPDISGFDVFEKIRENKELSNTPIIAVSANAMQYDIDKAIELGFLDYIVKPIDIFSFKNMLNNILIENK